MPQFPTPPDFAVQLAGRIDRRHRRRRRTGVAVIAALAVVGVTSAAVLTAAGGDGGGASRAVACPGPATPLVVASSAEKAALMTRFAADFSADGRDADGRCVQVTVIKKSSGAAATALASGWTAADGPQPDVWSPSGSIWLPLLEARLLAAQHSSMIPTPESVPHVAASPMVVAMPRPMATALGWPTKPIGWADLLALASARQGWGTYGHPEWGLFSLGKTNPNFSHAGLEGTIATYYAAVGRTSGLTEADITNAATRRFVAGVEQAVVRYGDNTASFQSDWLRADTEGKALSYISALITEENLIPAYNEGNPTADPALAGKTVKPTVPLVAVYPKEGTFVADHPYAVLSAPWVTPAKRAAAEAFLGYLLSPQVQARWQQNHFRDAKGRPGPEADQSIGVTPTEPARVLRPPTPAITKLVLDSWAELRKTANVINLIDVSGSMAGRLEGSSKSKLDAARDAALASLKLFTDDDEVGLWSFSGGVRGKIDYTQIVDVGPMRGSVDGVRRRAAIAAGLKALKPNGDTGLYNSIAAAYGSVLQGYRTDRINAVVVLTDGKNDAQGGLELPALLKLIGGPAGGKIRVITIAYGPDADQDVLAQIARATKGAAYVAPTTADIPKVYSAALSNL